MEQLQPDETTITGDWLFDKGKMTGDNACHRIEWLIKSCLEYIATDKSGWERLYLDPNDGRLWEHTYPHSEMHGGGPPQLNIISREDAAAKYGIEFPGKSSS
jgi:hypothetical protein